MIKPSTVNFNPQTMKPCHCSAAKQAACPFKIELAIPKESLELSEPPQSLPSAKELAQAVNTSPSLAREQPDAEVLPKRDQSSSEQASSPAWALSTSPSSAESHCGPLTQLQD